MPPFLLGLVLAFNLLAFALFGIDKVLARRRSRRIPEAHLLLAALFTGCGGAWLGSSVFRHKTRKTSFRIKLVVVTLLNAVWVYLYWQLEHGGDAGTA